MRGGSGKSHSGVQASAVSRQSGLDMFTDVIVIGGGQAGLAAGYYLRQVGLSFHIVEAHDRLGDSWRRRYDSLTLFTSRQYSELPGLRVQGDPGGYPTKDEVADYLEKYANHFTMPISTGTRVVRVSREGDLFHVTLDSGASLVARAVIVATGPFQRPFVPPFASRFSPAVAQFSAEDYKRPSDTPAGTVLVAGDGATGRQIALELATTRKVVLATGKQRNVVPQRLLGRDIFWWLTKTGMVKASKDSWLGQRLRERDPFPGRHLSVARLADEGIEIRGRVEATEGRAVRFKGGAESSVDAVIWALGYRDDFTWLDIPGALDSSGATPLHEKGVAPVAGLFYLGRSWQSSRGSALICGVARDAEYVVSRLRQGLPFLGEQGQLRFGHAL